MTHLTLRLAATHDHWFEHPASKRAIPGLQLWWHHFAKKHSSSHTVLLEAMEWSGAGVIALLILVAALIANA